MSVEEIKNITERIETLTTLEAHEELREYLNDLNIVEVAEVMQELPDQSVSFFNQLAFQRAVAVFRVMDSNDQEDLLKKLAPAKVA